MIQIKIAGSDQNQAINDKCIHNGPVLSTVLSSLALSCLLPLVLC